MAAGLRRRVTDYVTQSGFGWLLEVEEDEEEEEEEEDGVVKAAALSATAGAAELGVLPVAVAGTTGAGDGAYGGHRAAAGPRPSLLYVGAPAGCTPYAGLCT